MAMKIGTLIETYRRVNRVTLREMAPQIGISVATLQRIENGNGQGKGNGVQVDLATALKIMEWLFSSGD